MSLEARTILVSLGSKPVLVGVDFTAEAGAVTAIVGPNGSGKTTLMRAMTGEVPYSGLVTLDGTDVARMEPWRLAARRAVLPQATPLAFPFNALEVVRLGLLSGTEAARQDLPGRALARVGLAGFETRFYQELSGGEQQRVQLARALVQVWEPRDEAGRPRWLFLDEPVASLDIGHQLEVMEIVRAFAGAGGGVVAVMHDLNLTAMVADRMALMQEGRIVEQGTPTEVMSDDTLSAAYGCHLRVGIAPRSGPYVLPQTAHRGHGSQANP